MALRVVQLGPFLCLQHDLGRSRRDTLRTPLRTNILASCKGDRHEHCAAALVNGESSGEQHPTAAAAAATGSTQRAAHAGRPSSITSQQCASDASTRTSGNGDGRPADGRSAAGGAAAHAQQHATHQQEMTEQPHNHHHHHQHHQHQSEQQASGAGPVGVWGQLLVNPLRLVFGKAWRKAVPLSVLFFASTFIFTMLQSLKDGIVVMNMGAEALPFLATFGTLPASLAFFSFYKSVLVPHVPPQHLFFATAAPFLAFYAFFAVVLYPLAPSLQNPPWLACLPEVLPRGLRGLAAMVQFWVYSLFFVAGDLWGPVMISLAFWTVADEVCTMEEAGQLYPQLGLLANLGLVGSGRFIKAVHGAVGQGAGMGPVLQVLVLCMLLTSLVMFVCKADINQRHLSIGHHVSHQTAHHHQHHTHHQHQQQQQQQQPLLQQEQQQVQRQHEQHLLHSLQHLRGHQQQELNAAAMQNSSSSNSLEQQQQQQRGQQQQHHTGILQPGLVPSSPRSGHGRTSWSDVLAILEHNRTAAALATSVVGFSVSYRMYEYSYKAQLQLAAADSVAYCCKLAEIQSAVGLATIAMMLMSRLIFKHFGWSVAALISPYSMLLSGTAFFGCSLFAQAASAAATPGAAVAAAATAGSSSSSTAWQASLLEAFWLAVQGIMTQLSRLGLAVPSFSGQQPQQELILVGLGAGFVTALASCACHNSLFTPCKQMVYKTLPAAEVNESKAAVDLVGGQFAKSAAGWLVQVLLLSFGNITAALPACFLIFVTSILAWLKATFQLSKQMAQYDGVLAAAEAAMKSSTVQQTATQQDVYSIQQQQGKQDVYSIQQQVDQQQWQEEYEQEGWQLPLPRELAVAAAGADHWPPSMAGSPEASMSGASSVLGSMDDSSSVSSSNAELGGVQVQPFSLQDAAYWDRIFAALVDNPLLLESVVLGHGLETQSGEEQQQQRQQQVVPVGSSKAVGTVKEGKQALHTLFES